MPKFIKVKDFAAQFISKSLQYGELHLISIGTSSDGHYVFRCVDDNHQEVKFRVPAFAETKKKGG